MPCRTLRLADGRIAIACGPRVRRPLLRCVVCGCPNTMCSMKLCDGPGLQPDTTCDRPVCTEHAVHRDPNTDFCPQHVHLVQHRETLHD